MIGRASDRKGRHARQRRGGLDACVAIAGLLVSLCLPMVRTANAENSFAVTPAGAMTVPRAGHTAVLLLDGRVLIAGGIIRDIGGYLDSTEYYSPATGKFTTGPWMTKSRFGHAAARLPNGKVLITGGATNGADGKSEELVTSTEIYDSAAATFTDPGSKPRVGVFERPVALPGGKILFSGSGPYQFYDPATGNFSDAGRMIEPRFAHTAVLMPNGKVLTAGGGATMWSHPKPDSEIYDPSTGISTRGSTMTSIRMRHAAVLLPNGKVLITGGTIGIGDRTLSSTEVYDPATLTFTSAAPMTVPRRDHAMVVLPDGKVLIVGGHDGSNYLKSAEIFSPPLALSQLPKIRPLVASPLPSGGTNPNLGRRVLTTDISITDISLDSDCRIQVKYANTGTLGINQNLRQQVWIVSTLADDTLGPVNLAPGVSTERVLQKRLSGTAAVKAVIDADNKLLDANRANNSMTKTLTCAGKAVGK